MNCLASKALSVESSLARGINDSFLVSSGKFFASKAVTSSTVLLAIVETALSSTAALLAAPAALFAPKAYSQITAYVKSAATTSVDAAKRTVGIRPMPVDEASSEETRNEPPISMKDQVRSFAKKHETALIAGAITASVLTAYYFGAFDFLATDYTIASIPTAEVATSLPSIELTALPPAPISLPTPPLDIGPLPTCPLPGPNDAALVLSKAPISPAKLPLTPFKAPSLPWVSLPPAPISLPTPPLDIAHLPICPLPGPNDAALVLSKAPSLSQKLPLTPFKAPSLPWVSLPPAPLALIPSAPSAAGNDLANFKALMTGSTVGMAALGLIAGANPVGALVIGGVTAFSVLPAAHVNFPTALSQLVAAV